MKYRMYISLVLLIGAVAIYYLWPSSEKLPKLGTIEEAQMTTINGESFQLSDERPKLISFFYTNCPDVCPMTLSDLTILQKNLSEKGIDEEAYQIISITLDPEVDTVNRITEYVNNFDISFDNWTFLRGTTEQTKQFTEQFDTMAFKKNPDGFITHSTTMYLVDTTNTIRSYHDMAVGGKSVNLKQLEQNIISLINEN